MEFWYSIRIGKIELYVDRLKGMPTKPLVDIWKEEDRGGVSLRLKLRRTSLIISKH